MPSAMLQNNITMPAANALPASCARRGAEERIVKTSHLAHAAMVSLHSLCCGLPILATLASSVLGAGLLGLQRGATLAHEQIHRVELALVVLSAAFVLLGAALEWRAHQRRRQAGEPGRVSLFFLASVGFLAFNAWFTTLHQLA